MRVGREWREEWREGVEGGREEEEKCYMYLRRSFDPKTWEVGKRRGK